MGDCDTMSLVRAELTVVPRSWVRAGQCQVISYLGILAGVLLSVYAVYSVEQLNTNFQLYNLDLSDRLGQMSSLMANFEAKPVNSQQMKTELYPMFDCSRTARLFDKGVVTYHTCLDTSNKSMNPDTGVYTTGPGQAGIYQISFTAKYVANSNGRFGAWCDIVVNNKVVADSQREYNGNRRTESSTHSVILLHKLRVGDRVHVVFNKDGSSYIHSDDDHDVHFTMRKVAEMPPEL